MPITMSEWRRLLTYGSLFLMFAVSLLNGSVVKWTWLFYTRIVFPSRYPAYTVEELPTSSCPHANANPLLNHIRAFVPSLNSSQNESNEESSAYYDDMARFITSHVNVLGELDSIQLWRMVQHAYPRDKAATLSSSSSSSSLSSPHKDHAQAREHVDDAFHKMVTSAWKSPLRTGLWNLHTGYPANARWRLLCEKLSLPQIRKYHHNPIESSETEPRMDCKDGRWQHSSRVITLHMLLQLSRYEHWIHKYQRFEPSDYFISGLFPVSWEQMLTHKLRYVLNRLPRAYTWCPRQAVSPVFYASPRTRDAAVKEANAKEESHTRPERQRDRTDDRADHERMLLPEGSLIQRFVPASLQAMVGHVPHTSTSVLHDAFHNVTEAMRRDWKRFEAKTSGMTVIDRHDGSTRFHRTQHDDESKEWPLEQDWEHGNWIPGVTIANLYRFYNLETSDSAHLLHLFNLSAIPSSYSWDEDVDDENAYLQSDDVRDNRASHYAHQEVFSDYHDTYRHRWMSCH